MREPATLLETSPEARPDFPPTPTIQLWMNSPPLNVNMAMAGFPLAASAVRSIKSIYFLVGYSISIERSILKVMVLPA